MRVLIVEDNEKVLKMLEIFMEREKFVVDTAMKGDEGFEKAKNNKYDLIILDIMLPQRSGFEIICGLRAIEVNTPILVISARGAVNDRIKALDLGADDYLVKDFALTELAARAKTLIRRSSGKSHNIYRCKNLTINLSDMVVTRGGQSLTLTKTEFRILEALIRRKNKIMSTEDMIKSIWGESASKVSSNKLNVHIRMLRQKVDEPFDDKLIKTVRGFGYVISDTKN